MRAQVTPLVTLCLLGLGAAPTACSSSKDTAPTSNTQAGAAGSASDEDAATSKAEEEEEVDAGEPTAADAADDVVVPCGNAGEICCGASKTCSDGLTCSDQFCLTCGAPPVPHEGCVNVATGATASAQQTFPDNPLSALNDNDVCQAWSSGYYPGVGDSGVGGTWFELDLGSDKTLDAMSFWVKQTPAHADVSLSFAYSSDDASWTPWLPATAVTTLDDNQPWQVDFSPPITARYFRVTFEQSPSFVSMRELALFDCTP